MIAIQNEQSQRDDLSLDRTKQYDNLPSNKIKTITSPNQVFLPSQFITHHPKAGLNTIVDAAAYLFSVIGTLKQMNSHRYLSKLQKELIEEINTFQAAISTHGYSSEYILICRYILCATIDDIIVNTSWGGQGQWDGHSLLTAFNQDHHQDKFYTILERIVKEPAHYIDLMELAYICLSLGYKGQYRATEYSQYQLEQITHHLYQHIRAYRGSFSKTLSPSPIKSIATTPKIEPDKNSPLFILFVTACVILVIFISLGYLLDVISNEAYKNLAQIGKSLSYETVSQ